MKEITVETKINVLSKNELSRIYTRLVDAAYSATNNSYAPYSHFHVGAAVLLENDVIITGSNQENAAYPSGLCAERVALFSANTQYPDVKVLAIAIAAVTNGKQVEMISPCGGCRQVMLEVEKRFKYPLRVLLCGSQKIYMIENATSLLPISFDGSDLP